MKNMLYLCTTMAKSKTDKDRKAKVVAFKEKVKTESKQTLTETENKMEIPQFRPFRQVPHWEPDAKFELTAQEFSTLQDFFNIFAEPINIMQDVFGRELSKGTINIKYIDNEGKEVDKDEVKEYYKQMQEYFQNQADRAVVEVEESQAVETAEVAE